ncbi:pilus assembly protein PilP [Pseudooceanicola nitratireducens]|uniref:pilus assembly protein PilP n=1 Tax=Pseudooceanicola nitratireducens TaxID=517719 RepID=UPI001C97DA74|nr:pilus assembly protein PilP [Pseudooceanicola nitratireducens]MBY6166426.1 pilus assembly protein PilP [Pseudooceanicola nitratireducens]MEC7297864.1 pilus assembly protein PilP [Pseudomonadota bacterium]MEC8667494.1 pilus assembly protein PilP [Pseudomonadota bacterium]
MAGTPENVAKLATDTEALDLGGIALLGTMIQPDGPKALLRTASGDVRKVAPGDRIGLAQVQAIGAGVVQISGFGGQQVLTMPQG